MSEKEHVANPLVDIYKDLIEQALKSMMAFPLQEPKSLSMETLDNGHMATRELLHAYANILNENKFSKKLKLKFLLNVEKRF